MLLQAWHSPCYPTISSNFLLSTSKPASTQANPATLDFADTFNLSHLQDLQDAALLQYGHFFTPSLSTSTPRPVCSPALFLRNLYLSTFFHVFSPLRTQKNMRTRGGNSSSTPRYQRYFSDPSSVLSSTNLPTPARRESYKTAEKAQSGFPLKSPRQNEPKTLACSNNDIYSSQHRFSRNLSDLCIAPLCKRLEKVPFSTPFQPATIHLFGRLI